MLISVLLRNYFLFYLIKLEPNNHKLFKQVILSELKINTSASQKTLCYDFY